METDLIELERRAKEAAAKVTAAKAEHWARGVMRNVAYDAGSGLEMASESARDYQRAGVPGPRIIPTPEEARMAQEAARRAQGLVNQSVGGFGSHYDGGPQAGALYVGTQGVAEQTRAPGRLFSRETILAILKGHLALATARPPEMNERDAIRALITVFENLE